MKKLNIYTLMIFYLSLQLLCKPGYVYEEISYLEREREGLREREGWSGRLAVRNIYGKVRLGRDDATTFSHHHKPH
jgi:hypothetical protein